MLTKHIRRVPFLAIGVLLISLVFTSCVSGASASGSKPTEGGTTEQTANVGGGVSLHYTVSGKGDPLLLIHGWPETLYSWRRIVSTLAQSHTVIALDLPGLGGSSPSPNGYDEQTVAEEVYHLITHLGYQHISVVGHDWGGVIAYALTTAHRDVVSRLAILDVALPGEGLEKSITTFQPGANSWWWWLNNAPNNIAEQLTQGKEEAFFATCIRAVTYNQAAFPESEIAHYAHDYAASGRMHAGFEYYRGYFKDVEETHASAKSLLPMPVLAIGGDHSAGPQVEASMKMVAKDVHGVVIKNSGHFIAEEQPNALSQQLLAFFK